MRQYPWLLGVAALCVVGTTTAGGAQETPTERESARSVVLKLDSLKSSLNIPELVARLTGPNAARDAIAARAKELMDTELLALGDDITRHPEIGFEEKRSVQLLTNNLVKHGFVVKQGTPNLPTAFVARYTRGEGGPRLGVIVEYDALRGTKGAFHGDQHSTQGPIGIAAAVAIAEFLTKSNTPATIVVFGAPGEEMMPPNAKTVMFESDVYAGIDVLMRSHSSSATSRPASGFGTCCMNIDGVKYTFTGAPAHQLTAWNGRNALTAVIHLFNNIDAIRSNIRPESRIQGVIVEGGAAPNVVPDRTVADFYIRYPDEIYLAQLSDMVDNAARAAALATGTKVKIEHYGKDRDGIGVASLNEGGLCLYEEVRRHRRGARARQATGLRGNGISLERHSGYRLQRQDLERTEPHLRDGGRRAGRRWARRVRRRRTGDGRAALRFRHAAGLPRHGQARVRDDPRTP
jgi:amidohydrolase